MSSIIELPQLEILRLKIVDAIRFLEKYWMIYIEKKYLELLKLS